MCETCGCSDGAKATVINLKTGKKTEITHEDPAAHQHSHSHTHPHNHPHDHSHDHTHDHGPGHEHNHSHSHDHADNHHHHHTHADDHQHKVALGQAVLQKNNELAERNRAWFSGREILALNLVSSPGAGKTTLLERTIKDLANTHDFYVVEGDQATANDGERIQAAGAPVVQVNTGTGCHLEADMVARGLKELAPKFGSIVLIENVGNLVCPALFDLGEQTKVAIVSVTEGEDKPIKYPHMFQASDLVIINKTDLLPHLNFDIDLCIANIAAVHPAAKVLQLSATTGEGMDQWYSWLDVEHKSTREQAFG